MSTKKIISNSAQETQLIAKELAVKILQENPGKYAVVFALEGELGAGKTTFLQGFAEGLGIEEKVLSPTFVVMKRFEIHPVKSAKGGVSQKAKQFDRVKDKNFKNFYHFDCYRLNDEQDLEVLDFKTILADPKNIIAIEWPERVEKLLPKKSVRIECRHLGDDKREFTIHG